jgi:hypothetical protein
VGPVTVRPGLAGGVQPVREVPTGGWVCRRRRFCEPAKRAQHPQGLAGCSPQPGGRESRPPRVADHN